MNNLPDEVRDGLKALQCCGTEADSQLVPSNPLPPSSATNSDDSQNQKFFGIAMKFYEDEQTKGYGSDPGAMSPTSQDLFHKAALLHAVAAVREQSLRVKATYDITWLGVHR